MSIDKATGPGNGTVDVTFRLPAEAGAESVSVVGDFNDWSPEAHEMRRVGDVFEVTAHLERGRSYRFRYLLDGDRWENDWAADSHVPNEFGGDDSLIDLTGTAGLDRGEAVRSKSRVAGSPKRTRRNASGARPAEAQVAPRPMEVPPSPLP